MLCSDKGVSVWGNEIPAQLIRVYHDDVVFHLGSQHSRAGTCVHGSKGQSFGPKEYTGRKLWGFGTSISPLQTFRSPRLASYSN